MKKNSWLMISAICTLTGASLAAAQPGHHGGRFEKFDANKDGVVTAQEVEAAALAKFNEADTNKDGKVTPEERKAVHAAKGKEHFAERDTNNNGVLERAEVERMPDEFFTKLDSDKSGTLSAAEMAAFGPGRHGRKGGEKGCHGAGPDADAALTKAEALTKAKAMMAKFDTNSDGKVTKDEAKAFMESHHGRRGHRHGGPEQNTL